MQRASSSLVTKKQEMLKIQTPSLGNQTEIDEIKTKIKLTVTNLSFFVTFHNAFVFAGSNSSVSLTTQN